MKNAREIIEIRTSQRVEILDITREVEGILSQFGVKEGLLNVYSRHSTSGVVINENESGLISDFQMALEKIIPQGAGYHHDRIDNNADSHIRGFLIGVVKPYLWKMVRLCWAPGRVFSLWNWTDHDKEN
ncbi:hypothetical protein GCM10025861_21340 [Methanobacterium petrolearium]|nr:hypothetical protein GCM10025861_21340 [Methanobacterium petrolearium]